eukprot:3342395-Pyramimonas_sp.AAC.1
MRAHSVAANHRLSRIPFGINGAMCTRERHRAPLPKSSNKLGFAWVQKSSATKTHGKFIVAQRGFFKASARSRSREFMGEP